MRLNGRRSKQDGAVMQMVCILQKGVFRPAMIFSGADTSAQHVADGSRPLTLPKAFINFSDTMQSVPRSCPALHAG